MDKGEIWMRIWMRIYETECHECGEDNLEEGGYLTYLRQDPELLLVCKRCFDNNPERYGLIYLEWNV